MQIIVKGGLVVATHDDGQITDPVAVYGAGAAAQSLPAGEPVPALLSEAPSNASRVVLGAILVHALDKTTKVTARDLAYVAGLSAAREDMASITRIAAIDGSTAEAWFDLALGTPAS